MSEQLQIPMPMWRAQYQLLGGHRRTATIVAVCVTVLLGGTYAVTRLSNQPFNNLAGWVLNFLAVIQCIILGLVGTNAIHRAMLRDYESKMMESHRLTPMSNTAVALGYLFGSTIQIVMIFALILVAGSIVSYLASLSVAQWAYGNLFLFNGAVTVWSAFLFFCMGPEKPFNPMPVIILLSTISVPAAILPAAGLLFNVYPVLLGFWLMTGGMTVDSSAVVIVAAVNLVFTLYWVFAAAVKYRRPDLPALNGARGLILLLLLLIIGTVGIVAFDRITRTTMTSFHEREFPRIQWIGTMIGALIMAAVPIAGAVRCRILARSGTSLRGWGDRLSPVGVAVVTAGLICIVMAGLGSPIWNYLLPPFTVETSKRDVVLLTWSYSALVCLIATISIRYVFELGYMLMKSPKFLVGFFFVIVWVLPPGIDAIRTTYLREFNRSAMHSWLMGCSPAGSIIVTWSDIDAPLVPGLVVQIVVAFFLALAAYRVRRRVLSSS